MSMGFNCKAFGELLKDVILKQTVSELESITGISGVRIKEYLDGGATKPMYDWELKRISAALGLTSDRDSKDIDLLEASGYDPFNLVSCPTCDGKGQLPSCGMILKGQITVPCHECNGTGIVQDNSFK